MPITGENPSQEFLRIVVEELRSIEAHLNIHDTARSGLRTTLTSNIRTPVPRLIDDVTLKFPIHVRYQKYRYVICTFCSALDFTHCAVDPIGTICAGC